MSNVLAHALFDLGRTVATPGALAELDRLGVSPASLLQRHVTGDFGDLDAHDRAANVDALEHGDRLLSAYNVNGCRFWVITEADRSVTTILLPEEY